MLDYVKRTGYLERLRESKDAPGVIKVIMGMRRCGKSTLMDQFAEELRNDGVAEDHIFHVNFESFEGQDAVSPDDLKKSLRDLPRHGMVYIMLDEIQEVDGWEMIVAALETVKNYDVYITGSNSNMLSTDLATHLSGRYIEICMFPLSFREYLELHPGDREGRFLQYLRYGGLPDADPDKGDRFCRGYLEGVFNTVLVKDVLARLKTDDIGKIKSIARFLYSNIGNITNRSAISRGCADARFHLAVCYETGAFGKVNYFKAAKWFSKAADSGIEEAYLFYGKNCLRLYEETKLDYFSEEALDALWTVAYDLPDANAELARCYMHGIGTEVSLKVAGDMIDFLESEGYAITELKAEYQKLMESETV